MRILLILWLLKFLLLTREYELLDSSVIWEFDSPLYFPNMEWTQWSIRSFQLYSSTIMKKKKYKVFVQVSNR